MCVCVTMDTKISHLANNNLVKTFTSQCLLCTGKIIICRWSYYTHTHTHIYIYI